MDLLFKLKLPLRVKQSNLVVGPEIETLREWQLSVPCLRPSEELSFVFLFACVAYNGGASGMISRFEAAWFAWAGWFGS
jgi:hypothetical protein